MAKNDKEVAKPVSKVRIRMFGDKATIYRNDGLPTIDDKATEAVVWLERNGYKHEEIEVLGGEKPSNWDVVFNLVPVVAEVEVTPEVVPEVVPETVSESTPVAEAVPEVAVEVVPEAVPEAAVGVVA